MKGTPQMACQLTIKLQFILNVVAHVHLPLLGGTALLDLVGTVFLLAILVLSAGGLVRASLA